MDIEVVGVLERTQELVSTLARVWERSVRATHDFLTEGDVASIALEVPAGVAGVAQLAVACEGAGAVAFAGVQNGKLEMLFVDSDARGRGVGRALLDYVVQHWDVCRLDVNEQNPQARGFYEHEGFSVVARSNFDTSGRPFPLLHMERAEGVRAQMASGAWFDAADAGLALDRGRAGASLRRFNGDAALSGDERKDILRGLFGSFGPGAGVAGGVQVDYGYRVFIGKGCFFNYNCTFLDGAPIVFGDDVWVGPGCTFATPLHPLLGRERAMRVDEDGANHLWERNLPICVGSDVWLASGVTVNPGVTIGEGAVIGSGSVVTKDIPPRVVAFGNPCRVVREITEADSIADALAEAGLA